MILTDKEPQFTLHVIVVLVAADTDNRLGYAISSVLVFHESPDTGTEGSVRIIGHRLVLTKSTSLDDVNETCKQEITVIDTNVFGPIRKLAAGQPK